jgi:hypothetical protein
MEAYIDDMMVKSPSATDHLADLEEVFSIMAVNMKLNPIKSLFRLSE